MILLLPPGTQHGRKAPSARGGFRHGHRRFEFAAVAGCHLADVAKELTRAVFPGACESKFATGVAGNAQGFDAGAAEVLMQDSDRVITDDVLRPGDGKGGNGNAARERLELHDAESVR